MTPRAFAKTSQVPVGGVTAMSKCASSKPPIYRTWSALFGKRWNSSSVTGATDEQNQWMHGDREFVLPPLPPGQVGTVGCGFVTMTVDPAIGDEVCVLFKEDPGC